MSSPSKPVSIGSPRLRQQVDSGNDEAAVQTPDLRLLRERFGTPPVGTTIPPFRSPGTITPLAIGTPVQSSSVNARPQSFRPVVGSLLGEAAGAGTGTPGDVPDMSALTEEEKIKVLRKHLVPAEQRMKHGSTRSRRSSSSSQQRPSDSQDQSGQSSRPPSPGPSRRENSEPFPLPYDAPGGDITYVVPSRILPCIKRLNTFASRHDIYKYQQRAHRNARPRTISAIVPQHVTGQDPAFEHIHEPGGFRRNYMLLRANEQGLDEPPVTSTFIDFLYLFGHFAGEDLEDESEEELETIDEEAPLYASAVQPSASHGILRREPYLRFPTSGSRTSLIEVLETPIKVHHDHTTETTPLIGDGTLSRRATRRSLSRRSLSRQRRSLRSSTGQHGDATVTQAVLMLLKAFIGTGVLFLGKACVR